MRAGTRLLLAALMGGAHASRRQRAFRRLLAQYRREVSPDPAPRAHKWTSPMRMSAGLEDERSNSSFGALAPAGRKRPRAEAAGTAPKRARDAGEETDQAGDDDVLGGTAPFRVDPALLAQHGNPESQ